MITKETLDRLETQATKSFIGCLNEQELLALITAARELATVKADREHWQRIATDEISNWATLDTILENAGFHCFDDHPTDAYYIGIEHGVNKLIAEYQKVKAELEMARAMKVEAQGGKIAIADSFAVDGLNLTLGECLDAMKILRMQNAVEKEGK